MLRVVLDTNVLVSVFLGGKTEKIMNLWREGAFILCLSEEISEEYKEVLERKNIPIEDVEEFLFMIEANIKSGFALRVQPARHYTIIEADADDNMFIDCAVEAQADYIVSGDRHLLEVKEFKGIRILSPHVFLNLME